MNAPTIHGTPAHPDSYYSRRAATRFITVHCAQTDSRWNGDIAEVRRWHVQENGWRDVGYHYFIRRDGTIEVGRPRWALGSHVKDHNHESIGVCMAGGCDEHQKEQNNFTPAQWTSLKAMLVYLTSLYPGAQINGHRDFPHVDKYCPSFDVKTWLAQNPLNG